MGSESSENLWALVLSGNRTFIGPLKDPPVGSDLVDLLMRGGYLKLEPAYEISITLIPRRGQDGQPMLEKNFSAEPLLLSFEGSPLFLKPDGLTLFRDMKDGDRNRYKTLVAQAERLAQNARAAAVGIVAPTQ